MKTYFIYETNDEGWYSGMTTHNLEGYLEKIGVVWEEEWEEDDKFGLKTPHIDIKSIPSDRHVVVFRLSDKLGYQEQIGEFNFFRECYDEVQDFITEFYREIITSANESLTIKKFDDFKE
jgi:hypothetical protein